MTRTRTEASVAGVTASHRMTLLLAFERSERTWRLGSRPGSATATHPAVSNPPSPDHESTVAGHADQDRVRKTTPASGKELFTDCSLALSSCPADHTRVCRGAESQRTELSRTTARRSAARVHKRNVVRSKPCVAGDDRQSFNAGGGNDQAVERIAMVRRKASDLGRVLEGNR